MTKTRRSSQFYVRFYALVSSWLLSSHNTFVQQVAVVLTKLFFSPTSLVCHNFLKTQRTALTHRDMGILSETKSIH